MFRVSAWEFLIHWTYKHEQVLVQARIVLRIMWIQTP